MGKVLSGSPGWSQGFWFSSLGEEMLSLDEMKKNSFKFEFY